MAKIFQVNIEKHLRLTLWKFNLPAQTHTHTNTLIINFGMGRPTCRGPLKKSTKSIFKIA